MGSRLEGAWKEFTREAFGSVYCFGEGFWAGTAAASVLVMGRIHVCEGQGTWGTPQRWAQHTQKSNTAPSTKGIPEVIFDWILVWEIVSFRSNWKGGYVFSLVKHFLFFREADAIRQFCMARDVLLPFKGHLCEHLGCKNTSDCYGHNYIYWITECWWWAFYSDILQTVKQRLLP